MTCTIDFQEKDEPGQPYPFILSALSDGEVVGIWRFAEHADRSRHLAQCIDIAVAEDPDRVRVQVPPTFDATYDRAE